MLARLVPRIIATHAVDHELAEMLKRATPVSLHVTVVEHWKGGNRLGYDVVDVTGTGLEKK